MGEVQAVKTVEVKKYTLPKFKVDIQTDKKFYLPKEIIKGKVNAYYFFGKPLEQAEVTIKAQTFDAEFREFANVKLTLDKDGKGEFEITLPDYFVGQPLERGNAFVNLQINVKDKAGQTQKIEKNINVSSTALNIVCVPESGELVPGIENIIYLVVYYPDGSPTKATLKIKTADKETTVDTDNTGFASFTYTPKKEHIKRKYEDWQDPITGEWQYRRSYCEIQVEAKDSTGTQLTTSVHIPVDSKVDNLLVRLDKAIYKQGETINCTIFSTSKTDMVFLDIVRKGQTYFMDTIDIRRGKGEYRFAIPQDLFGNVELHVYKILKDGQIIRDSRLIYVHPASEVNIKVSLDKEVYLPAEEAIIKFRVEDRNGLPAQSAIGVVVVDEAVYALQEIQPGLEKIYFTLEQEITKPRYQIKMQYQMADLILDGKELEHARQNIATMILANNVIPYRRWEVNTIASRLKEFQQKIQDLAWKLVVYIYRNIKNASVFTYIDRVNKKRKIRKNILDRAIKYGIFKPQECLDPWGRKLTSKKSHRYFKLFKFTLERWIEYLTTPRILAMREVEYASVSGKEALIARIEEAKAPPLPQEQYQEIRRIREWFPETLYWNAQIITDKNGIADVKLPLADSITSWRLTAMANSKNGLLGSTTKDIRVFQDFFVDIDFPVFLTQNDIVSVPIAVFNYLKEPQKVKLVVQKEKWFELLDEDEKVIQLQANEVRSMYFKIKVKDIGYNKFTVLAYGTKMSDAISRSIEVVPDGKKFEVVINDRLAREQTHTISIPRRSIKDAYKLIFKVYPGVFSQIIDGLEGLFRIPYGCFEQTSSITYPNVLALMYLKKTGRTKPEVVMRALECINLGYQRLLTFEVSDGGFHWWGQPPANQILSAWGLLEFTDMEKVYEIDHNIIERTKKWLLGKQNKQEGWWLENTLSYTWSGVSGKLAQTAYITWALLEAGQKGEEIDKAIEFIKDNIAHANNDPYTLGLIANALVLHNSQDKVLESILNNLDDIKKEKLEKGICYWETSRPTFYYATGRAGSVEATSLIALAMIRANKLHNTVNKALSFIVKSRDASGTWGSTQATILSLRTLIMAMTGTEPKSDIKIALSVNGREYTVDVAKDQWDVMQILDLKETTKTGNNMVKITTDAEGTNLMYQLVGRYFLPWSMVEPAEEIEAISFKVKYDRIKLKVDDLLGVKVSMKYLGRIPTYMVIVDLGIPAGFSVVPDAFEKMLEEGKIKKFSITGRQITLYLGEVKPEQKITFKYQLRARYPIKVKTPTSQAYEYYTPENRAIASPVELVVE